MNNKIEPTFQSLQENYLLRVNCFLHEMQITIITYGKTFKGFTQKIDFENSRGICSVLKSPQ